MWCTQVRALADMLACNLGRHTVDNSKLYHSLTPPHRPGKSNKTCTPSTASFDIPWSPAPTGPRIFPTRRLLPCRAVSPVGRNASRSACKKERLKGLIYSCSQTTQFIQGRAKNGSPCAGRDQGRRRRHLFLSPPHCTRSARGARGRSPCEEEEESEGGGASIRKSSMLR